MLLKCHRAVLDQDETVILGQEDRKKLVKMSNGFEEWEGSFQISFYQLLPPKPLGIIVAFAARQLLGKLILRGVLTHCPKRSIFVQKFIFH